jgi:hypothetical protein
MIKFLRPTVEKINTERGKVSKDIRFSIKTKDIRQDKDLILIDYLFLIDYGGAKIELEGNIVGKGDEKEIETLVKHWKENQEMHKQLFAIFYNILVSSLFNKIAMICEIVNLPLPINLPLIRDINTKEEKVKDLSKVDEDKEESNEKLEDLEE